MSDSAIRRGLALGAAAAGVLALGLIAPGSAQAVPVSPAAPAVSCKVTSFSPATVVVGSAVVKKKFSIKTSGCKPGDWAVVLQPYTNDLSKMLKATNKAPTITFSPKTFTDADAGKGHLVSVGAVNASALSGPYFNLLRAASWSGSFNATPEPVKKGKKLTVQATLKHVDWTQKTAKKMPFVTYAGPSVAVQFKAKGASSYKTVKTVKAGKGGKVSTTVTASKSGTWRVRFGGNSTTGAAVSNGDAVTVTAP